ncbi:LIM interaction domain (LID) domain-containing protein [Aphelenchoides besseyi]|nr:LIM interaction domain (LID) domain-containing protein [Aphelenchoides besseyi]KAI6235485.1 LIM interaction domain (LID) domain-containing protein [Aphelenchoides besseyi]
MGTNPPPMGMAGVIPIPMSGQYAAPVGPPYLDARIQEMNQRISAFFHNRTILSENEVHQWFEAFSYEFFDDKALMTITMPDRIPESKYFLNRTLIPRFFRSLIENGVSNLMFLCNASHEYAASNGNMIFPALSSDNFELHALLEIPIRTKVRAVGRSFIEYTPYDEVFGYRIKHWMMHLHAADEACQISEEEMEPEILRQKRQGFTISGLPVGTINFLKMCTVLVPMQRLMLWCKESTNQNTKPKEALKAVVFEDFNRRNRQTMPNPAVGSINGGHGAVMPEETTTKAKPQRKRTRKTANNNTNGTASASGSSKKSKANANATSMSNGPPMSSTMANQSSFPVNPNFNHMGYTHEVLVVSEPSMMGNEFGESDERAISRVENAQYDQIKL